MTVKKSRLIPILCLFFVVVLVLPSICKSQEGKKNVVYAELLGPGLLYSINYERVVSDNITARIGASILPFSYDRPSSSMIVFPLMANYLSGSGNSKLEIGAGIDAVIMRNKTYGDFEPLPSVRIRNTYDMLLVGSLGYRFQPTNGGFLFRIVASPIFVPLNGSFFPSVGCSMGTCF
jgi:hypothetical protein